MKKNMGTLDRALRVIIAGVLIALCYNGIFTGTLAIILIVLSAVFLITSLISFCPLYLPFGLSTFRKKVHHKS
jgi:hypothetical protein